MQLTSLVTFPSDFVWSGLTGVADLSRLLMNEGREKWTPPRTIRSFPYGSTVGGFVVALVALTVSIPVSLVTVAFYVGFRLAEDYLLTPRIIGRAVKVPGGVTVVAVLIGAALLGIVGAFVAIPVAPAVQLLFSELVFPTLDES